MGPLILQSSLIFLSYGVESDMARGGEARGLSLASDIGGAARCRFCISITLEQIWPALIR